jgi:LPXTG-motif cell wall-anchored protein
VYPPPIGVLPITGFNMIAFGLVAAALIIGGLIFLRVAHFSRSRR